MATKEQQDITLSAGLALGIVCSSRIDASQSKYPLGMGLLDFDMSFWQAWRKWEYSRLFQQISPLAESNGRCLKPSRFITKNTKRKRSGTSLVTCSEQGRIIVSEDLRSGDYSPEEVAKSINDDVPLEAWVSLAEGVYVPADLND